MNRIRIVTEKLGEIAIALIAIGAKVGMTGLALVAAGLRARTYQQNTFGPQVRALCNEGNSIAGKHAGLVKWLADVLGKKMAAFNRADGTFFSRFRDWINETFGQNPPGGSGTKEIDVEKIASEEQVVEEKLPEKQKSGSLELEKMNITEGTKCYDYVKVQREKKGWLMPTGMMGTFGVGLYDGKHTGEGSFTDSSGNAFSYSQTPKLGALVIETSRGSSGAGVKGHVSFVKTIDVDDNGNVTSYTVAETNWGKTIAEQTQVHTETFTWDANNNAYISSKGNRSPDCFVY